MKKILILLILLTPFIGYSGDKNIQGNWKEVSRNNVQKQTVNYKATIFLEFLAGNEYI